MDDYEARATKAEQLAQSLLKRVEALEKKAPSSTSSSKVDADEVKKLREERDAAVAYAKKLELENISLKQSLKDGNQASKFEFQVAPSSSHKFASRVSIKSLLHAPQKGIEFEGKTVTVSGWARTTRRQGAGTFTFVELNDGSCFANLQVVVNQNVKGFEEVSGPHSGPGASMLFTGVVVKSPGQGQVIELQASEAELLGKCTPGDYPLAKKGHKLETLRGIAHLRPRTNTFGAVARVRNACAFAIHSYFQSRGYYYVHTPIITASDCEGAGEMFQVTTLLQAGNATLDEVSTRPEDLKAAKKRIDYSKDFFNKPAFLTVSGQLNGEMYATALSKIYTFGPTFRAENSHTARHMAEFWMIEPEIAFADLNDLMDTAEEFLKFVVKFVLENNYEDLEFFEKQYSKDLIARLTGLLKKPFKRLTYTEAVEILLKSGQKFEVPVKWGIDLQSEHEQYLAEKVFNQPVILTDYPKEIKAFYMRVNEDGKTVRAMDVLVPKIGEVVGGSQREERLEVLEKRIDELKLSKEAYKYYLDLRRFGTVMHSGFGLGFERLLMMITGIENIRDTIPFPRYPGHAEF